MKRALLVLTAALSACGPAKGGGFEITVTGEGAATGGIPFPAASDGAPYFQDGWSVSFSQVIVFIGDIGISENPDRSVGDQSRTGALVVQTTGPFVVDLAQHGPRESKEQNGTAWPVATITSPKLDTTQKYAFGYALKAASADATRLNTVDEATVAMMIAEGDSVWFTGAAEFKGTSCRSTVAGYDFDRIPKRVNFSFGYKVPTTYKNCLNPELQPSGSRGIQAISGQNATTQLTFHLDHQFWESLQEDAPLRFDLIAARKSVPVGQTASAPSSLTRADLAGVDFQAGRDAQGLALPWRYCAESLVNDRQMGTVSYDPKGVPVSAAGGTAGLKDLAEYMAYNLSSFGHLNNDGFCLPAPAARPCAPPKSCTNPALNHRYGCCRLPRARAAPRFPNSGVSRRNGRTIRWMLSRPMG